MICKNLVPKPIIRSKICGSENKNFPIFNSILSVSNGNALLYSDMQTLVSDISKGNGELLSATVLRLSVDASKAAWHLARKKDWN